MSSVHPYDYTDIRIGQGRARLRGRVPAQARAVPRRAVAGRCRRANLTRSGLYGPPFQTLRKLFSADAFLPPVLGSHAHQRGRGILGVARRSGVRCVRLLHFIKPACCFYPRSGELGIQGEFMPTADRGRRPPAHAGKLRPWERFTITVVFSVVAAAVVAVRDRKSVV